ncbi:MAG: 1,2-dihydroxy-3-keto-5-methylthiopentene dioxygenase [Halothiobacillaceae bacterium]
MSELRIYAENDPNPLAIVSDHDRIAEQLNSVGVRFERWSANQPLAADADQDAIIAAYRADIDRLMAENGFSSVDVISVGPDHPDREALRQKFLDEHTHSEHEVRFFVEGQGLFMLHIGERVYGVLCEQGDLLSVPEGTPHWFDMGERPNVKAIRLFTDPSGWVAHYTGDEIASRFPKLETS